MLVSAFCFTLLGLSTPSTTCSFHIYMDSQSFSNLVYLASGFELSDISQQALVQLSYCLLLAEIHSLNLRTYPSRLGHKPVFRASLLEPICMFEDLESGSAGTSSQMVRRTEISGQDACDFYRRILEGISMASEERE